MEWNDCKLTHPEKVAQYEVLMQTPTGVKKDMAWWVGTAWYIPYSFIEIFPVKWRKINIQVTLGEMGIKTEPTESVESVLRKVADAWEKTLR